MKNKQKLFTKLELETYSKNMIEQFAEKIKEEFVFKDNFRTLNNEKCLLLTEPVFNEIINKLQKEIQEKGRKMK